MAWPSTQLRVEIVNVTGTNLPDSINEETLDVEWSSGIAPGARIRVYASGSLDFVDLDQALDQILTDLTTPDGKGLHQLSVSLGLGEKFMVPDEVTTEHDLFRRLVAKG